MSPHRIMSVGLIGLLLAVPIANGQIIEGFPRAVDGDTRVLDCPTTASVVEWKKNGGDTQAPLIGSYDRSKDTATMNPPWDNGDVSIAQVGDINKLAIKVKHSRDNGITIYCVEKGINRKTVATFKMTVQIPPTITGLTLNGKSVTGNDIVLRDDTRAILVAVMTPDPSVSPTITWIIDGVEYGRGFSVGLTIPKAQRTWDGTELKCTATNVHGTSSIPKTITVYFGPTISKPTQDQVFMIKEGDTFSLTVEYEAKPDVNTYEWFTPNNAANPDPDHTTNTLTLPNIHPSQAGSYRMRVTNSVSKSAENEFQIKVLYPPSIDMTIQKKTVTCGVTPGVPTEYSFTFFVQKVQGTIVRNVTYVASKGDYDPTSYQDSGEYSCGVRNEYMGELVGEDVGRVEVLTASAPFFIDIPKDFIVHEGENKPIKVAFYSVPIYNSVVWKVNDTSSTHTVEEIDVDLPFHGHNIISTKAYQAIFPITKATLQSKGNYTLTVKNSVTTISTTIEVNYTPNATLPSAPTFVNPPKSRVITVGETAELIVQFYCIPTYTSHTWTLARTTRIITFKADTRDSFVRKTDAMHRVRYLGDDVNVSVYEAVLVIREVTDDSAGVYTLVVENGLGKEEHSIKVEVKPVTTSTNVGAIAGGVVGGVVIVICVGIIAFCCISRRRRKPREDERVTYTHSTRETDADPYLKPVVSHNDVTTPTVPTPESEEGTYIDIIDADYEYGRATHDPHPDAQYTGMVSTEYYSLPDDGKGKEILATGAGSGVKQADMAKGEYMDMTGSQYYNVPLDSKYENVNTHMT